jgi:uncharacterized membrane protein
MPVDVMADVVIDRPCEDVAAYASDLNNVGDWYESIESVSWKTPPPVAAGSQLDIVVSVLGRRTTYAYEILDFVPGERLAMRSGDGPVPLETTYTWAPIDDGRTRMAIRNYGEPSGFAKLGAPMMSAGIRRSSQRDLKTLKRILEER